MAITMTPSRSAGKRRTLRERAEAIAKRKFAKRWRSTEGTIVDRNLLLFDREFFIQGVLAGYRAGKREGKAEAMKATGWGEP